MSESSFLHPVVLTAREKIAEQRARLKVRHQEGAAGLELCREWTEEVDAIVLELVQAAAGMVEGLASDMLCVLALGGYGRRDLAPYSDVDVTVLHPQTSQMIAEAFSKNLAKLLQDAGFECVLSTRTPEMTLALARKDATILTSIMESRRIFGSENIYGSFLSKLRVLCRRYCKRLLVLIEQARLEERRKFGNIVFLLNPNIKRSRGGLRDLQLVRWVGFLRFGEREFDALHSRGLLDQESLTALHRGYHFLLRLRNQLHFQHNRCQDSLDRVDQPQLAAWYGCQGSEGILPVEQFMREYFEFTSAIRYSSAHFVENARLHSPLLENIGIWMSLRLGPDYRIGLKHIAANESGLKKLQTDPAKVLEFMMLANQHNRRIEHTTWRAIRTAMLNRPPTTLGDEAITQFLQLLRHTHRLGEMLRKLHELRVLEQLLPAMKHARCLMQFTEYHKYTVDAHCIRSVEVATELQESSTLLGNVYRSIKKKEILHLALLLHDLGKGFVRDHSEVGKDIAEEAAARLKLTAAERDLLVFLVHKHLLMAWTAYRLDTMQLDTIVKFAASVGSLEALQMLFVLTCADEGAVGPDGLNSWKLDLITQLYQRTESQFRDEKPDQRFQEELDARRRAVRAQLPPLLDQAWWDEQIQALPAAYLLRFAPSRLIRELGYIHQLHAEQPARAWAEYLPDLHAVEYTVAMLQTGKPIGTFHRITGALSSQGLQILVAEIHTQPGSIAWDRFIVQDLDYESPPEDRRTQICRAIEAAVHPSNANPPTFRSVWKSKAWRDRQNLQTQPTLVQFDNNTSEEFTIISIFAYDRRGLLYSISKVLFDEEIVLHVAKISTHLDQVVDVFYVTDLQSRKITEPTRLYMLRQKLLYAIEQE